MNEDRATPTNVSLYDRHRAIIERMQDRYGMNFSAALQAILTDWDRIDRARIAQTRPEFGVQDADPLKVTQ